MIPKDLVPLRVPGTTGTANGSMCRWARS